MTAPAFAETSGRGPNLAMGPEAPAAEAAPLEVRVATSKTAQKRLGGRRVRRLLSIELEDEAVVSDAAHGALAGDLIRVWIDVPKPRRALIEVRRGERSVARRALAIGGFPADVAARVVAIATSEMVRVQARVQRRPIRDDNLTPGHGDSEAAASFAFGGALSALVLPASEPAWTLGPEVSLEHRAGVSAQTLYGRWQFGADDSRYLRWLELGASADVRLSLAPRWRLRLGAKAGGVSLSLPQAGHGEPTSDWTVRAGGSFGLEASLTPSSWLGLSIEPGALVRKVEVEDASGARSEIGGFALGVGLGLVAGP